jgi:hypothetical protein
MTNTLTAQDHTVRHYPEDSAARVVTYTGIPLDTPITVRMKGQLFRLPLGYFRDWTLAWQTVEDTLRVHDILGLDIHFWMPSKRWPEIDGIATATFRPKEVTHAFEPGAFTVQTTITIEEAEGTDYVPPLKKYSNFREAYSDHPNYRERSEGFGLRRLFLTTGGPGSGLNYVNEDDVIPQAMIDCYGINTAPNPLCRAYGYFPSDKMAIFAVIPVQALPEWREIFFTARTLFYKFKSNAENQN